MRFSTLRWSDHGSMPLALLVVTVGLALSATITPVVVRQFQATRSVDSRNLALNAAQAGMDVMMARVRAAANEKHEGLLENLPPCTLAGDGGVAAAGEELVYDVTIEYRDQDGVKMPECPVYNVPTTALVTSYGYGEGPGGCNHPPARFKTRPCRVLMATYVFATSNTNIPGGQIRIDTSTLGDQCIDANTAAKTPPAGTVPVMKACNGGSRQQFGYTADLYLKLIYSESTSAPYGMCLDSGTARANNAAITFQPCPAARESRFMWSLDDSSRFHATTPTFGVDGTYCMSLETTNGVNSRIVLYSCGSGDRSIFRSAPGVGAGMAGDDTAQLVNYEQFSRCLDVTGLSVRSTYMIAWFCKQSPNGVVTWNQRWVHPVPTPPDITATGPIVVSTNNSVNPPEDRNKVWCLRSPLTANAGTYTTVVECPTAASKAAPELQWTVYHDTGVYATSYRIKDSAGFCLTPTTQNVPRGDPTLHTDGTSKVKVAVCNSSELQKWNAPANINKPTPLTDLNEK